jgi:hypothetical protein
MSNEFTVTIEENNLITASTNLNNPATLIEGLEDVDVSTSGKQNGSVLVYRTTTNKWTATTVLDAQDITGGHY